MTNKLKAIFTILPLIAMAAAGVTLIKSLFYGFHDDTVPFFSLVISLSIALVCAVLIGGAAVCAVVSLRSKNRRSQLGCIGIMLLLNVLFAGVCAVCHHSKLTMIIICAAVTAVILALAAVFTKISPEPKGESQ